MRILVTGGTVFASRYIAEYFVTRGDEVYVLNRGSRPQSAGVNHICRDRHELGDALKSHRFDLVIDVTAYNAADVNDLLDALGDFGDYVMISSSAVYPETNVQPFTEEQTIGHNIHWEDYGTNKIAAEKALTERVPNAYILRPPYLCGAMNNLYREAFVFECAEQGRPFYVPSDGSMKLQFFDIRDLCRLIERIVEVKPEYHIINTGYPEPITVVDWVKLCYGIVGKTPEIRYVPHEINCRNYFPFRDYEYVLDTARQCTLVHDLTPLETTLRASYEWWKDHYELVAKKDFLRYIDENLTKALTYKTYHALPEDAVYIRTVVFVEEQCFEYEFDEADKTALHIIGYDANGEPVSVSRILDGDGEEYVFGRLAVMKAHRGNNLGSEMIAEAERIIRDMGGKSVRLHAQCRAADFYHKCGYIEYGDIDDEEGIPHIWMRKILR